MLATPASPFLGSFREADCGKTFEFYKAEENGFGMPHLIDVGMDRPLFGRVLKTVVHVVTDIDEDSKEPGMALIEKWKIRRV